ncbi:SusC/RagA family TonB-linked outer membrane protein [Parapedobacter soli]|uniref:SusC/RagA family TonB-linked outer membrane protein n=1 Tax=Parapedobacter soli TaxID=416955 RepID=UPI0021C6C181|nr:SusC/RagA family TonB-linked outer membrane protein [Parapedobacter soli]
MKPIIYLITLLIIGNSTTAVAQEVLRGRVIGPSGEPLAGTSVLLIGSRRSVATDGAGNFSFAAANLPDSLLFSHVGYLPEKVFVAKTSSKSLDVRLYPDKNVLQEVEINTGYYTVPKERATGSFTHVDQALLNRSTSPNLLDRLEGIASGVLFDRRNLTGADVGGQPEIRVRGINTIESNSEPLIVIDNFPFEGDINSINPNDIESITVLKDAAASSIWGARAGNGVIVITTKQARYGQRIQLSINANTGVSERPDLFYSQQYLPSPTVMAIQKELFERGAYSENDLTRIPHYVELLIKRRDGLISDETFQTEEDYMRQTDLRQQFLDQMYDRAVNQQYSVNVRGGGDRHNYFISANHMQDRGTVKLSRESRTNIGVQNGFKLTDWLESGGALWYSNQRRHEGGGIQYDRAYDIYDGLLGRDGNPASISSMFRINYHEEAESTGLLDWVNRPLDELGLNERSHEDQALRLNGFANASIGNMFRVSATYQYTRSTGGNETYYDKDSYYVRDMVNKFTQPDGRRIIPHNAIMDYGAQQLGYTHAGRLQVNFRNTFGTGHELTALSGAEIRQATLVSKVGNIVYNFDTETWLGSTLFDHSQFYPLRPAGSGSMLIPAGDYVPNRTLNRNLSYFLNGSYVYSGRYTLSGSIRWDGSNLLGVKTNQKGTALWSVGGSWDIAREPFYKVTALPHLRLRATYGSAGNIDKSQSHYPTINVQTNGITNLRQSTLSSPGNPSLGWEQVNTANLGIDWAIKNQRISGSFEGYHKRATNLLGAMLTDPTLGIPSNSTFKTNYGNMEVVGYDLQVTSRNLTGRFGWNTTLLISGSRNRITYLDRSVQRNAMRYVTNYVPVEGMSRDIVYAMPWHGLDGSNGLPVVVVDGQRTTEAPAYRAFADNLPYDGLVKAGVDVPPVFGSLRNGFEWRGFSADFLLTFKFGHVFRRKSIASGQEYVTFAPQYHMDYFKRWQKAGDEARTVVPAWQENYDFYLWQYYTYSEALVTKGDIIKLQDVSLRYRFNQRNDKRVWLEDWSVYAYFRNFGTVWRANKQGIDSDYPNTDYPAPLHISFGIQATF